MKYPNGAAYSTLSPRWAMMIVCVWLGTSCGSDKANDTQVPAAETESRSPSTMDPTTAEPSPPASDPTVTSSAGPIPTTPAPMATTSDDPAPDTSSPGTDLAIARIPATQQGIQFQFDYSLDSNGFFDSEDRRAVLEQAAAVWSALLHDDFEDIPAGSTIHVVDPSSDEGVSMDVVLEETVDDLIIFVGCADVPFSGLERSNTGELNTADPLQAKLAERFYGDDHEVWTSSISFECDNTWFIDDTPETADDVPSGQSDLLTVTLHELGHSLGLSYNPKFLELTSDEGFVGTQAMEVFGGPVPVDTEEGHILQDVGDYLMTPQAPRGVRFPSLLEVAMLADLGFET